jgi:hypothetical protein
MRDVVAYGRSCQAAYSSSWMRPRVGRGDWAADTVVPVDAPRLCLPDQAAEMRTSGAADGGCNDGHGREVRVRAGPG